MGLPGDEDRIGAEDELALEGGDERLPWLESDDDEDQPGVDTGRVVAFAAIGLLALVLILGALWWFLRGGDEDLVADGSVIEAPEEPYRTKPADPGGRQVEGTGQTSFEVAEGQQVEGRVAGSGIPTPSIDREQAQAGVEAGADKRIPTGAVGVQIGAYATRASAEAGWNQLVGRFEALQGRNHRILVGTADSSTVFRLQALAGSIDEAEALCSSLKSAGGDCQVKR